MRERGRRIVIGMSGASGQVLAVETLRALRDTDVEVHIVASDVARALVTHETDLAWDDVVAMADVVHPDGDLFASISSGSFVTLGMVVVPCSMATLAEIANGVASTLLTRAADVTLKEGRPLVLVARETPLSLIHLRNMVKVTEAGATVLPPVMTMYSRPETIEEMARHIVGKVLDRFGIENDLYDRWG